MGRGLTLMAVTLLVLALGGVAAIPLTNQPSFCASCHTIKPAYDSWILSSHQSVTCVDCHVRPGFSGFIHDKVLAGLEDVAITFFGTPTDPHNLQSHVDSSVCISCHRAILRVTEVSSRDLPQPVKEVGLIMDHGEHMKAFEKRGKDEGCTTCHSRVVHGVPIKGYPIVIPRGHVKLDEQPYEPAFPQDSVLWKTTMADCMRCHDGKQTYEGEVLSKRCETCHLPDKIGGFLF